MEAKITIRSLKTNEEMRLIAGLERVIWGSDPIPIHQTYTAVKNGGLMLGAFSGAVIVGFSYSFPGIANGKLHLCSHMLGIHPDYQQMGIGKSLKEEQLKCAKEMGYDLIRWTFDPLECRNAYLNVSKLFAVCDTYLENCYGEMEDGLNKGLPSDRFNIEWWITSVRVEEKWVPKIAEYNRPFNISQSEKGNPLLLYSGETFLTNSEGIEVPIPQNFQGIKKNEPELALDWRMKTRAIFQSLFGAGYVLVNVSRTSENVHYYQLVKKESIPL
ncbi:GNAT family N-acetyltransferase [Psychrobacillus sp.]|uniref:GNAT family N-acetyltransferase n=1 Tax=Psychrobacillus sp. TaxID=1871623 RepID=UPI0028BEBB8F|nr:GNAT family N-acetyltransferase [Psychrobacillus sp.]